MKVAHDHTSGAHKAFSIYTLFGQETSLHRINEKLYENGIEFYGDLEKLTEREFWKIIGRTTEQNIQKINEILGDFPVEFRRPH